MKWILGSTSTLKTKALEQFLQLHSLEATIMTKNVSSGVSSQPMSDEETMQGAIHRAQHAHEVGAYSIGLEGGITKVGTTYFVCNWGAMKDPSGHLYVARGATIPLPQEVISEVIEQKEELQPVLQSYAQKRNERFSGGALGYFTNGWKTRKEAYVEILELLYGQVVCKMRHK